jgi:putative ABC transport system permease protein
LPELRRLRLLLLPLAGDALAEIRAQWRQHSLTLLGIVWGGAAVVLLLSLGTGFYEYLDLNFKKTGDRYTVAYGQYTTTEMGGARPGRAIQLDRDDLERVRAGVPSARWIAGEFQRGSVAARTPFRTRTAVVSATTSDLQWIKVLRVARGRFIDAGDDADGRRVVVLGANLPEIFFADGRALGGRIHIEGRPFEVIGVLQKKGRQFVTNNGLHDDMMWIPLSQGQRLFDLGDRVGSIVVNPYRLDDVPLLHAELGTALRPYHHVAAEDEEAIRLMSVTQFIKPMKLIGVGLELLFGFIGTVILAMAGVGVANLMVAVANQRRPELAVRRAMGARKSDLRFQFLVETTLVVMLGGVLGVSIGASLVALVGMIPAESVPTLRIEPSVVITAFAVLVGVGLVAGLTPARVAARADPATALRVT